MHKPTSSGSGVNRRVPCAGILLTILVLGLVLVFFFPKMCVVGGLRGGPIAPGETAYREDYICTGVRYDYCPNWPDYGCDRLCFGWVTNRVCSLESYDTVAGMSREPAECQGSSLHLWGFPGN